MAIGPTTHEETMTAEASTESTPTTGALRLALRKIDPHLWDAALASFFAAAGFIYVLTAPDLSPPFRQFDAIGVILLLAVTLPLVALRTYPLQVFIIIGSASMIGAALNEPTINIGYVTGALALFSVASRSSILRAMVAALGASLTLIVVFAFLLYRDMASIWLGVASWFLFSAVWLAGVVRHAYAENRREAREARERARADRERAELYLHDLEMHAQEAVALERSRLARELHDVVGHALNVVVLQAGAAQRLLDKKPEVARESLSSIEAAGRQALADIERMLGILRAEAADREELGPQPGLTDIGGLIEQVREAGLPVSFSNTCATVGLPSSLDMSGYRIVQEALTNTLKHAGAGAQATVRLRCNGDWFEIECVDDGHGLPPAAQFNERLTGGRGLLGMRERVLLFGGELEVGPRPEGGFRVFARLPLEGTGSLQRGVGAAGATGGSHER
jgi:signal transduction histidine kinase